MRVALLQAAKVINIDSNNSYSILFSVLSRKYIMRDVSVFYVSTSKAS